VQAIHDALLQHSATIELEDGSEEEYSPVLEYYLEAQKSVQRGASVSWATIEREISNAEILLKCVFFSTYVDVI
jgi:hypothetical protein